MIGGITKPRLRKRVVTIFVIAVLFPCLFLGYLGLKSIKQEKQWQQQLVRENLERSLSLTIDQIESAFDDQIRASLRQLLPPPQLTAAYITSLRKLKTQSSLVHDVFLLDKELRLVFPKTFRNGEGAEIKNMSTLRLQESEYLHAGDLLEVLGKLDEALNEYQKSFSSRLTESVQAAILSRIARCQFKKSDYENARRTYQRIINEDNNQFYGEGMPYVLVAHLQLLEIAETKNLSSDVISQLLDFYRMLVEQSDKLEHAQYSFCLDRVQSRMQSQQQFLSQSQRATLDSIVRLEKENENEQVFRDFLQINVLPGIKQEIKSKWSGGSRFNNSDERKDILYISGQADSAAWAIGVRVNDDSKSPIRFIGVRIRREAFTDAALLVLKESPPHEEVRIALLDTAERILFPAGLSSATIVLKKPFSRFEELASGTKLALVAMGENPLEAISSRSLIIYYVLLGSVIVLIALGIVFILRDISREEQISVMKSEFISNVSHEIKTPIATIRTLAENLNEGWVTGEEKQREYFHLIEREAERLTHLVENILDFSRIERAKKTYRMETTSIGDATKKAIERFRLLVDGHGVLIKENIENDLPLFMLDSEAYEQVLLNLLDNAVKYSRDDKVIEVSARRQNDLIIIEVSDHGIGISKKDSEKIFEKFFRSPIPDGRKIPGSGIGLTLVKEIIKAHGGTIEVESEIGSGSTFKLSFPLSNDSRQKSDG
ncbi:MAG: HAMP domain-containing histidine kinase [Bacteroidetes bacterium]|nr:HAMP domain-containing histidine kinase [Bacteroidota bacterium]MBU2586112.1 HAMP domain-containing histidine kinase [Bacteroidota bacterium]